jgi:hypothetical protein
LQDEKTAQWAKETDSLMHQLQLAHEATKQMGDEVNDRHALMNKINADRQARLVWFPLATSAPGLGSPLPHLRRGWAHPLQVEPIVLRGLPTLCCVMRWRRCAVD